MGDPPPWNLTHFFARGVVRTKRFNHNRTRSLLLDSQRKYFLLPRLGRKIPTSLPMSGWPNTTIIFVRDNANNQSCLASSPESLLRMDSLLLLNAVKPFRHQSPTVAHFDSTGWTSHHSHSVSNPNLIGDLINRQAAQLAIIDSFTGSSQPQLHLSCMTEFQILAF